MMLTVTLMISGAPRGSPRLRVRVFLAQLLLPCLFSLLHFLAHLLFQMKGRRGAFRLFLFFLHHVRLRSQAWSPTFQQGVRAQPFRDEGNGTKSHVLRHWTTIAAPASLFAMVAQPARKVGATIAAVDAIVGDRKWLRTAVSVQIATSTRSGCAPP